MRNAAGPHRKRKLFGPSCTHTTGNRGHAVPFQLGWRRLFVTIGLFSVNWSRERLAIREKLEFGLPVSISPWNKPNWQIYLFFLLFFLALVLTSLQHRRSSMDYGFLCKFIFLKRIWRIEFSRDSFYFLSYTYTVFYHTHIKNLSLNFIKHFYVIHYISYFTTLSLKRSFKKLYKSIFTPFISLKRLSSCIS